MRATAILVNIDLTRRNIYTQPGLKGKFVNKATKNKGHARNKRYANNQLTTSLPVETGMPLEMKR